jgi:hypothetical protein
MEEAGMTQNIFISYSRRELGFVDDLVSKLEGESYNVWLDYRALVPGSPWNVQIEKGLEDSDTILLIVSKAALASKNVTKEWHEFLKQWICHKSLNHLSGWTSAAVITQD